ncbi:hypothetical protein COU60_05425 [Candidatus Pacearchaeota archaeon CG10_big_fil_rev_8_21_14_0_10_34_76]|nr:MAG: hypothetical protein COU60_05425 [Candidatus Pacearchaeota archaeon CG10_big_fil_rev_8_21_14_0_10_34_76]
MVNCVLFDKDGVIFDMEPVYARANVEVLGRYGMGLTDEEYFLHWTRNGGTLKGFLNGRADRDYDSIVKERREIIEGILRKGVPIIDGAEELLQRLRGSYLLSLVTSSHKDVTDIALEETGFRRYFDNVVTVEDVLRGKPDPEAFLLAAERLNADPSDCVVVEDAEKGIVAAHRAGMKSIAVYSPYTENNDFSLANVCVKDLREITLEMIASI